MIQKKINNTFQEMEMFIQQDKKGEILQKEIDKTIIIIL